MKNYIINIFLINQLIKYFVDQFCQFYINSKFYKFIRNNYRICIFFFYIFKLFDEAKTMISK